MAPVHPLATRVSDPLGDGTLQRLPADRALRATESSTLSLVVARSAELVGGWVVRVVRFVRRLGRRMRRRLVGDA